MVCFRHTIKEQCGVMICFHFTTKFSVLQVTKYTIFHIISVFERFHSPLGHTLGNLTSTSRFQKFKQDKCEQQCFASSLLHVPPTKQKDRTSNV